MHLSVLRPYFSPYQVLNLYIMYLNDRLEKLAFGTMAGKAKVFGTLTGLGGAMLLTFYKGVEVNIWPTHLELLNHGPPASHPAASSKSLLGLLLAFACCISLTFWLLVQVIYLHFIVNSNVVLTII